MPMLIFAVVQADLFGTLKRNPIEFTNALFWINVRADEFQSTATEMAVYQSFLMIKRSRPFINALRLSVKSQTVASTQLVRTICGAHCTGSAIITRNAAKSQVNTQRTL